MADKKMIKRPGKTLIVKTDQEFSTDKLVGLVQHNSVADNKHFLVFDNVENSKKAFKIIKSDYNLSVRYAYYKLYFTITGINDTSDYSLIKKNHMAWLTNLGTNVLYYKLYKKDDKLIGCGDFTIDSKEDMDKLIGDNGCKTFLFDTYSGSFYRYTKKDSKKVE